MAKNKSIIKLKGTVENLCFYTLNGKEVVRAAVGPSASRIKNDPAFANVKKNNYEFAGATYISKAIRQGWGSIAKQFQDTYMASRLTGVCRKIIAKGAGKLGQRQGNLRQHGQGLVGFQLHKENPFHHTYSGQFQVTHTPDRAQVTLFNDTLTLSDFKKRPPRASHVQFTALLCGVSTYCWNETVSQYQPQNRTQNGISTLQTTHWIPLAQLPNTLQMVFTIPNQILPEQDIAILLSVGITYGAQEDTTLQPLKTAKAMQIVAII